MKLEPEGWVELSSYRTASGQGGNRALRRGGLTFEGTEPRGAWGVVFPLCSSFILSLAVGRGRGRGSAASPSPTSL